ncbi:hypothetical protein FBU31_008012, partial [Coemansia sp. 'formosensis']
MTIPGRVGYQCSNYYRYLVENRLINDPNYVLDEKGKAHFLFTTKKKNPDGTAMRVFRKHNKPHVRMSREKYGYSDSDEDEDEANQSTASSVRGANTAAESLTATTEVAVASSAESVDNDAGRKSTTATVVSASGRKAGRVASSGRKRKRRGRFGDASSDDDVIRANEVELSDDVGGSGNDTSDGEYQGLSTSKRRCGGRIRNGDWTDFGVGSEARRGSRKRINNTDSGNSSAIEPLSRVVGSAGATQAGSTSTVSMAVAAAAAPSVGVAESAYEDSDPDSDVSEVDVDPSNPLPDLIDPITLEPVSKPAISPFGHVMGYNSWVRCLMFPPE